MMALKFEHVVRLQHTMRTEHNFQNELACWATLRLGARIDAEQTSKMLGMAAHDIPILVAGGLLEPLGNPAQNSTKWFCAVEIIQLAANREWLHKATKKLAQHWRNENSRKSKKCSVNCSVPAVKSVETVTTEE